MPVLPNVAGEAGSVPVHPGSALHTSRRPPVISLLSIAGNLSTFSRMSALSCAAVSVGATERISAAAPDTCGAAIEPPVSQPYFEERKVE